MVAGYEDFDSDGDEDIVNSHSEVSKKGNKMCRLHTLKRVLTVLVNSFLHRILDSLQFVK